MTGIRTLGRSAALVTAASVALFGVPAAHAAETGEAQTYLVVFSAQSLPSNAAASISSAGGTVVSTYGQIGVVVARSSASTFRANLMRNPKIQGVSGTAAFATHLGDGAIDAGNAQDGPVPGTPAPGAD